MLQHAFKLWECLHPADVGAHTERPRAINNRSYGFYHSISVFCNRPFFLQQNLRKEEKIS